MVPSISSQNKYKIENLLPNMSDEVEPEIKYTMTPIENKKLKQLME